MLSCRFDSVSLTLKISGDDPDSMRLAGPVTLRSEALNLTIDLGADMAAIYAGLELQQEAQLEAVDSIALDPIQWDE